MANFHKALPVAELAKGKGCAVTIDNKSIALFNINGKFHAIDNTCPHRMGPLSEGTLAGSTVSCPWHGWTFDVTTGDCGVNPLAKIGVYETKIDGDFVYVKA